MSLIFKLAFLPTFHNNLQITVPKSWVQDKSSQVSRSGFFLRKLKMVTMIHTSTDLSVSGEV